MKIIITQVEDVSSDNVEIKRFTLLKEIPYIRGSQFHFGGVLMMENVKELYCADHDLGTLMELGGKEVDGNFEIDISGKFMDISRCRYKNGVITTPMRAWLVSKLFCLRALEIRK